MSDERIDITNPIFNTKPTLKFSETMKVKEDMWEDMYIRYNTMGYKKSDLKEWFEFKTKRRICYKTIDRWIKRQQLYDDVHYIRRKGVKEVTINFFKRNKEEAINPNLLK